MTPLNAAVPASSAARIAPEALERLLDCLRVGGGFNFTDYSRLSLARRVSERLRRAGVPDVDAYMKLLQSHPAEGDALCRTLWINVTDFFRDHAAWEHLQNRVLPGLLARRRDGTPLRIWSAGCASGQEPYSLALLLAEALGPAGLAGRVEIVATDVNAEALAHAERGVYSNRVLAAVPPALQEKYFVPAGESWQVRPELRQGICFRQHNLLQECPSGKFDLILCRNTLIYFRPHAQGQVLARLRRRLAADGYLLLGRSECPIFHDADRPFEKRFAPADLKTRLYKISRPT